MLILYIVFTLLISIFNAWSVGRGWTEAKIVGGWPRFMAWCGATMAAIGFTWIYLIVVACVAGPDGFNKLTAEQVEQFLSLGYLAIIVPLIGSGIAITVQSWAAFWQRRDLGNGAIAAWNTYAQFHNLAGAIQEVPSAWGAVADLFRTDDEDDDGVAALVVGVAALAIGSGVLTTIIIVRTVAARVQRNLAFRAAMAALPEM
jgi:hypothetical protein